MCTHDFCLFLVFLSLFDKLWFDDWLLIYNKTNIQWVCHQSLHFKRSSKWSRNLQMSLPWHEFISQTSDQQSSILTTEAKSFGIPWSWWKPGWISPVNSWPQCIAWVWWPVDWDCPANWPLVPVPASSTPPLSTERTRWPPPHSTGSSPGRHSHISVSTTINAI